LNIQIIIMLFDLANYKVLSRTIFWKWGFDDYQKYLIELENKECY